MQLAIPRLNVKATKIAIEGMRLEHEGEMYHAALPVTAPGSTCQYAAYLST